MKKYSMKKPENNIFSAENDEVFDPEERLFNSLDNECLTSDAYQMKLKKLKSTSKTQNSEKK